MTDRDENVLTWDTTPTVGPTCDYFGGCTMVATTASLCAFHFDAMERPDIATLQFEYENRRCTADCCAVDDQEAA